MKMKKFSNTSSQNDIIGELTRQTCNNIENLHENSPPQCQDFNTPILNWNASVNSLEKENAMEIAQNKKKWSINGNKKIRHQEYMLRSNMIIIDCNKKNDTVIHGNVNDKETNERN